MSHRIYIIGVSGSRKSVLAKAISDKLNLPTFDLDDIFWKKKYSVKRTDESCRKQINKLLNKESSWIIEGIFSRWTKNVARRASIIIWLDINRNLISYRLIKRFLSRSKKDKIKDTVSLIRLQRKYHQYKETTNKSDYFGHLKLVKPYAKKLVIIKTRHQLKEYLKTVS